MNTGLIIVAAVISGVAVLLLIIRSTLALVRKRMAREVQSRFDASEIVRLELDANFFGQKSKGAAQIRGNGALVLTRDELWFMLALPRREYAIPLADITEVSLPKSYRGKTIFRSLLCVEVRSSGSDDSMAWAVRDADAWKAAIDATKSQR